MLGKLAAGLLNLTGLLLVGLPILSLAMLFGGIAPERLVASYIASFSTMISMGCLSLAVSIWSLRSRDAVIQSYVVIGLLFFAPYLLDDVFSYLPASEWWRWGAAQLLTCNPYGFQFSLLPSLFTGGTSGMWSGLQELLQAQAVLAALSLSIAIFGIRRAHLRGISASPRQRRWRLPSWRYRPAVGAHAMLWKELFSGRATGKLAFLVRLSIGGLLVAFVWSAIYQFVARSVFDEYGYFVVFAGTLLALGSLVLIGVRASQLVATERERDTWIGVLSTPLNASEIVFSKLAGSLYVAVLPVALLLTTWIATCFVYPMFIFAIPFAVATLLILALSAAATGLFFSFWCRTSTRALLTTLTTMLLAYGAYYIMCPCLLLPVMWMGGERDSTLFMTAVLTPLVPYLAGYPVAIGVWGASGNSELALHFAYLTGNLFYLGMSVALLTYCIQRFDRLAGRATAQGPEGVGRAIERAAGKPADSSPAEQGS